MTEVDDSQFFKAGSHYCAECIGNRELHAPGCSVPAQLEALRNPPKPKKATKPRKKKVSNG